MNTTDPELQAWLDAVPPPNKENPFSEAVGIVPMGGGDPIPFSREFARELTAIVDQNLYSHAPDRCSRVEMAKVLIAVAHVLTLR